MFVNPHHWVHPQERSETRAIMAEQSRQITEQTAQLARLQLKLARTQSDLREFLERVLQAELAPGE